MPSVACLKQAAQEIRDNSCTSAEDKWAWLEEVSQQQLSTWRHVLTIEGVFTEGKFASGRHHRAGRRVSKGKWWRTC